MDEINKIKDYLNAETKERKDIVKKISNYIAAFDYADKLFITLSASFGTLSILSHAIIVGIPVGIAGGFFFYMDRSYLVYDSKMGSFQFTNDKISVWKSTGIFNYLDNSNMNAVGDSGGVLPTKF